MSIQHNDSLTETIYSFMGISASLPTTAYVKMVDIWMIFTMTIPLLEVSLHTYKETLNIKLRELDSATATVKIRPAWQINSSDGKK